MSDVAAAARVDCEGWVCLNAFQVRRCLTTGDRFPVYVASIIII